MVAVPEIRGARSTTLEAYISVRAVGCSATGSSTTTRGTTSKLRGEGRKRWDCNTWNFYFHVQIQTWNVDLQNFTIWNLINSVWHMIFFLNVWDCNTENVNFTRWGSKFDEFNLTYDFSILQRHTLSFKILRFDIFDIHCENSRPSLQCETS